MEDPHQAPLILHRQGRDVTIDQQAGGQLLIRPGVDPHRLPLHQLAHRPQGIGDQQGLEGDAAKQALLAVDHIELLK
ncbi:hypothetical protein D3C79_701410 [compost metagenome]